MTVGSLELCRIFSRSGFDNPINGNIIMRVFRKLTCAESLKAHSEYDDRYRFIFSI